MRIFYGVQGTGNGHISRANAIASALVAYPDIELTWLLSGGTKAELFHASNTYLNPTGFTFVTKNGSVQLAETVLFSHPIRFVKDVRKLNLNDFDLVITDYEPITAWAAKFQKRMCIGIGHQYAFQYSIPIRGANKLSRFAMNNFAPAATNLGLHWFHFGQPILPPICDLESKNRRRIDESKFVVYLPAENQKEVFTQLKQIDSSQFFVYGGGLEWQDKGNIHTRPLSRSGFKKDLIDCNGVITNSGFELISECLALGIKVFTKPLNRQLEQLSNAAALEELGYARVSDRITSSIIRQWQEDWSPVKVGYPDVPASIAEWLMTGQRESVEELSNLLWREVRVERFN